jgi:glutathione-specific gamma-glutamylcyclotransferase
VNDEARHADIDPALMLRDPQALLQQTQRHWRQLGSAGGLWVFGYASLIWRPEFDAVERRHARVHGWHRAFRMRSRVNRGTAQQPGLVFALLPGGSCHGMAYRLAPERAEEELQRLWAREMPTGVYDPRFLPARTASGTVLALSFTLSRRSEALMPHLSDAQMLHILRHARGRYGSTLHYLEETARCLRQHQVPDREVERLVALAQRHGLL